MTASLAFGVVPVARRAAENDPVLAGLFAGSLPGERQDQTLRAVLASIATPLVEKILSDAVSRGALSAADKPDVANDVMLRLVRKLRRLVADPDENSIARFDQYVGAVAYHTIEEHQRSLDPLRARFETRARYILTHTPGLALWGRETALCGLVEWVGRRDSVPLGDSSALQVAADPLEDIKQLRPLVRQLVAGNGAPVRLDDLVNTLVITAGLAGERFVSSDVLHWQSSDSPVGKSLEHREYLVRLWGEIEDLPIRQRRALLLQLAVDSGESAARVLATMGIASIRRMAASLEMTLPDFLALWGDLPLPDRRIADMLGATRQQVINLRKSARDRLARRMRRRHGFTTGAP